MSRGHEERISRMRSLADHADQVRSKADEIRLDAARQLQQSRDRHRTVTTQTARTERADGKPKRRH